jgi:hypothetical protein
VSVSRLKATAYRFLVYWASLCLVRPSLACRASEFWSAQSENAPTDTVPALNSH